MSEWCRCGLYIGEHVILPDEVYIERERIRDRILYCEFIGETGTGMLFRTQFKKGWKTDDPLEFWSYRSFISFASVYCGDVKIYRSDGMLLRAKLEDAADGTITKYEGYHLEYSKEVDEWQQY